MIGKLARMGVVAVTALLLGACGQDRPDPPQDAQDDTARSIFRPEFQVEPIEGMQAPAPLETQILFEEGEELTEAATAELATVLAAPQVKDGGAITLRGHTDSGGDDEANIRASQARAEAVRDWMVENGIAEERITVIAFGEQNPVAPNALPDGTPDEEGRAANRRVEIEVRTRNAPAAPKAPTLAETLAADADEDSGGTEAPDEE